jgi:hypothetical protein
MKFVMEGQERGDLLIQVAAWAGFFCTMLLHIEEWHCQSKFKASFSRISCAFSYVTFNEIPNRVGALMVNMLTSSPVDRSHELWSG